LRPRILGGGAPDLDTLDQAREMGSVRPLRDLRTDLYALTALGDGVRVVRTT
jgi:hypothetical protein